MTVVQNQAAVPTATGLSYFDSCYDPSLDTTDVRLGNLVYPIKTCRDCGKDPVSKFFAEGVLIYVSNLAKVAGFINRKKYVVSWKDAQSDMIYTGVLDFEAMLYTTNAPGNIGRQGFGLAGIGAALYTRSTDFVSAWTAFLADLDLNGMRAVNPDCITALSTIVGQSLADLEHRGKGRWVLRELPDIGGPIADIEGHEIESVRDALCRVDDMLQLVESLAHPSDAAATGERVCKFQGPQMSKLINFIKRRKHTVLLGPTGVGKSLSAFEAFLTLGYQQRGVDYQVFVGHDEVKSSDLLGAYQPTMDAGKFIWVNGVLPRAMVANGGRGQPLLIEEFTRMPRRAQNAVLSVLSDGYLVLNEHPVEIGQSGEIITAGPDFVLIADMNVDPSVDDLELYGAAFASRVRKLWYDYPSTAMLKVILSQQVPELPVQARTGVISMYDAVLKRWKAQELAVPVSARDCVYWAEEVAAYLGEGGMSSGLREAALEGARVTWLRDVAGNDPARIKSFEAEIEGHFRKAAGTGTKSDTAAHRS